MDSQNNEEELAQVLKYGRCQGHHCGQRGIAQEDHSCPYSAELYSDESPCNCCDVCEHQCGMEI